MTGKLEIMRAKELRGEIVLKLYEFFSEDIPVATLKNLLRYKGYYAEKDIMKAIAYLSDDERRYLSIKRDEDNYWNSLVQLTAKGVNLAEGDNSYEVGVIMNE